MDLRRQGRVVVVLRSAALSGMEEGAKKDTAVVENVFFEEYVTMQAALTMPQGLVSLLPPGLRYDGEGSGYLRVVPVDLEMIGIVHSAMWEQVPHPNSCPVVGAKVLFTRTTNKYWEVDKNQAPSSRQGLPADKMTLSHRVISTNASRRQRQDDTCGSGGGGQGFLTPGCRACVYLG